MVIMSSSGLVDAYLYEKIDLHEGKEWLWHTVQRLKTG